MRLSILVQRAADSLANRWHEDFEFSTIDWKNRIVTGAGMSGPAKFSVEVDFFRPFTTLWSRCSICGGGGTVCSHAAALVRELDESGIPDRIEDEGFAPCTFAPSRKKERTPSKAWKSQLNRLSQRVSYVPAPTPPATLPAGREPIYVVQRSRYESSEDALDIQVATRPVAAGPPAKPGKPAKRNKSSNSIYRNFSSGIRALAASPDPLDRDMAERISLSMDSCEMSSMRGQLRFSVPIETSMELIARLARSGKLYLNSAHAITDDMPLLNWLADERFQLKFQVVPAGSEHVDLGLCAASASMSIGHDQLKLVDSWHFVDAQNRLGLFARSTPGSKFFQELGDRPIRVPRRDAGEMVEKLLNLPASLGIEFTGCDDVRPARVQAVPTPRIHVKAPDYDTSYLEAEVQFDYDGILVPLEQTKAEIFDKSRQAIVQVDSAFHDRSLTHLCSLGVKLRRGYNSTHLTFNKKKLPAIVGNLIRQGWRVEADGKLYRTGSRFEINVATGIDWFELQGTAHFEGASIDLPRLLQSLRSGQQTITLDDGSIGIIPEQWMKKFAGVASLASGENGSATFSRSQIGMLDALLTEQADINVDEKFAAARAALRQFDRVHPQEPPEGFVGSLRPYQKLAQGWFAFLRDLGFGGCLADDMGLGKTIQVLSMLETRRQEQAGPTLIVVPRSLVFNWIAEAGRFTPNLRILDQSHSQRLRGTDHLRDYDVVLTTYGTIRQDIAFLKDFEFDYVILDEAQAIKNAATESAKAARLLHGKHKLALSGTPIENHLGELGSLFDFLNPGMLGRLGRFADLALDADADQRKLIAGAVRPFILRRTKKQVAPELPDRVEQTVVVELDSTQRRAYDELRDYYRQSLMDRIAAEGIGKSQIVILEALLRLRQAACHPGLIDKTRADQPSAKLDELLARLKTAVESSERVLVFSQFTSLLAIVKLQLKQAGIEFLYLDGQTKNRQALVEQFQSGTGPAVFLISLKAGGVGLNLTAARTVYLLDPWWNPAVEAQAIDRTHRIGQHQTVFATRLIAADTVEQKVLELQSRKKGLADAIINADNAGISSLTRADVELLLA